MTANSIFAIDPRLLGEMDAISGTALICSVLRCEATRLQIPLQRVVISSKITAKDGGVDAKVEDVPAGASLLKKGSSYLQIKTGASFKPWLKQHLLKELFGKPDSKPSKARLGKEVRACLDKKGRYLLMTLGHDLLPAQHTDAVEQITAIFQECGYKKPSVEVLGQGQIVGLLESYPSLSLELKGLGDAPFQNLTEWAKNADMQVPLTLGDVQRKFLDDVRSAWRGHQIQHIRVIGEPGIGKTRLVLEAASEDDLRAATIYVPHAEDFQSSALFTELLKPDREYTANLVIDECDERERASIWNALKGKPHIKLITIDHGPETSFDLSMQVFQCPQLPTEQIVAILTGYIGKRADVSNWAEWCEGSPRVAHAVGDNLKRNPKDILKSPATVPIWKRFVLGHKRFHSRSGEEHFIVLRHIALFQRFGFEDPVSDEAKFISRLCSEADPNITWARFQSIVRHHQGRRILQGRHTLFIVPKALHIHLWVDFWDQHGVGFDFRGFIDRLPEGLKHWFLRLFIYAHASPVAQGVVKSILAFPSGPFSEREFLVSQVGTRLLNYLAEADPPATLTLLERTLGTWTLDDLRAWSTGRQDIVWALEKIAVWRDLFPRAATLLARLSLAENAKNSNNATGTLAQLFGVGVGWAPTEAPPDDRFPVLEGLVKSSDPAERSLGLKLCGEWLGTRGGTRIVGAEYQGMRPTLQFWRPATYGEMFDAWRKVWRMVRLELASWDVHTRSLGAARLIDSGSELIRFEAMADEVMGTLLELADDPAVDKGHFTRVVIRELRNRFAKYPKGVLSKLAALDKKLTGISFWDRFCRFVLFTTWDEDHSIKGDVVKEETLPKSRVQKLAREVTKDIALFRTHLPQLLVSDGHRLSQFGYEVAIQANDARFDEEIVGTLKRISGKATSGFIAGYLAAIRERDATRGEALTFQLLEEPGLRTIVVHVILRAGASERVVRKLLTLYRDGSIAGRVFSQFGFSDRRGDVPKSLVDEVITALLDRHDQEALSICLELVDGYYCREPSGGALPKDLIYRVLTTVQKSMLDRDGMRDYYWHRVGKRFRAQYPEKDLELLSALIKSVNRMSRLGGQNEVSNIADDIVQANPKEAWGVISAALERNADDAYYIVTWLGDGGFGGNRSPGAIRFIEPLDIITWTSAAPKERIHLIYHALPRTLDFSEGGAITVQFIDAFGIRKRLVRL